MPFSSSKLGVLRLQKFSITATFAKFPQNPMAKISLTALLKVHDQWLSYFVMKLNLDIFRTPCRLNRMLLIEKELIMRYELVGNSSKITIIT